MKEWFLKYWLEVVFGVAVAGMGAAFKRLSKKVHKQSSDQKSLRDGTQALLRNAIIQEHEKYTKRGYIPVYGMENVLSMYQAYHALGGNGTVTKLIEELQELPTKPAHEEMIL